MAATTMREITVTSPPPAFTLSTGSVIDENQNSSHANLKLAEECTKDTSNQFCKKSRAHENRADSTVPDGYERCFSPHSTSDESGRTSSPFNCKLCRLTFPTRENLYLHNHLNHSETPKMGDSSTTTEDCSTSNNIDSNSPNSGDTKESPESDDSVLKSLRSARRNYRKEDNKRKSDSDHEPWTPTRRKPRGVNNNESADEDFQCSVCCLDFTSWSILQQHLEVSHPDVHAEGKTNDNRKRPEFSTPKLRLDRRNLKNLPKVIGFGDINFIEFSSEKFPLVAKDVCEKSLHLSKDEFCFECRFCGRGFPCASALEIHTNTCEINHRKEVKIVKKNKRKSTPKFRPQAVTSDSESDGNIEIDLCDKQRNDFFNSLDLRNNGRSSKSSSVKSSEDETDRKADLIQRNDVKPDLADIQSIISVANIPALNTKNLSAPHRPAEERPHGLNVQVHSSQSSPGGYSNLSMSSPNFSVLSLISPNYSSSDQAEEEAQDCFAAECRRMKLRGEFPCKLCNQVFPNLRALKGHNRVHVSVASGTPSSPYRCNICSYTSLDKATLIRHMRSHNGDRPYECAMCNYAFTTKANCERHLRNRHSKMTREEVKSSIIYHPSEDPINDSEFQKTSEMNRKNTERSKETKPEFSIPMNLKINLASLKEKVKSEDLFQAEHQELLKNMSNGHEELTKTEAGTMTEDISCKRDVDVIEEENWSNDEALDLRVNKPQSQPPRSVCSDEPEDLTKKEQNKEFNNNIEEKEPKEVSNEGLPFDQKFGDMNNLVKLYSAMHPNLNVNQIHQIILAHINFPGLLQRLQFPPFLMPQSVFHNSNYAKNFSPKDALGLQMSGGSIMGDNKRNAAAAQLFQQEAIAKIMLKREEDRLANDFYKKPSETFEKLRLNNNAYFTESDKKAFQKILVNRESEVKEPVYQISAKPIESIVDNRNSSVKMVIKNGVLMPKQKQRRYRTERPFSCEHCSARFTLRSNMERHIKQQHPQHWTQKSRYNIGNGRKSDTAKLSMGGEYFKHYEPSTTPTSILSRGDVSSTGGDHWESCKSPDKSGEKTDESEDEPTHYSDEEEETKDDLIIDEGAVEDRARLIAEFLNKKRAERREECLENGKDPAPQDLASVSKMLDNVTQTQAFQKYFQDGSRKEDDDYRREEGDRSEEEEGLVAGSTSSDENRSESETSTKQKKKSAYSLAPNRVSCPYCSRKFPWTSSLRRHVLTHTGQKPFKCTHCPLLFTTKSNCDRHLLRKHGREALIASSGHTENHEGSGNTKNPNQTTQSTNSSQSPNYTMRNVPERPYKCTHCPSSTFSSLSNLNKHLSSKHPNGEEPQEPCPSPEPPRIRNMNPHAPPNVTISPNFPLNIPKALSIIPQYPRDSFKSKRFPINVPSVRVQEWSPSCNGDRDLDDRSFRKRSSSDETEACDRKRTSPDLTKISPGDSDAEPSRMDLPPIPASELPFKCHLCEGSFGERSEALDHIRSSHPSEFQLLVSKGALENNSEEDRLPHDDHDESDITRGRFPDYANRKVMCAFCMRRFWSAEDLRRHMRTHTGERPFSCDVCQRKFTLKHSMLRHRKKHNTHEELFVGSDEEHHLNNNLPITVTSLRKSMDSDEPSNTTILLQTLTRREDSRDKISVDEH